MSISCEFDIDRISQDEFHSLDYEIMELAFDLHNELGRFCDEKLYQNELAYRCREMGFESVCTELPVDVSFGEFSKRYFVDLLINGSALYELKTVSAITSLHRKQTLNYLLLLGLNHGKLVNMRPGSVEHEFVSTRLTPERRRQTQIHTGGWEDLTDGSKWFRELLCEMIEDWGAFLDVALYSEAIRFLRGGKDSVIRRVEIVDRDKRVIGEQFMNFLDEGVVFEISAVTQDIEHYEAHLRRLGSHTKLDAIHWVNFNHHEVCFKTLRRRSMIPNDFAVK